MQVICGDYRICRVSSVDIDSRLISPSGGGRCQVGPPSPVPPPHPARPALTARGRRACFDARCCLSRCFSWSRTALVEIRPPSINSVIAGAVLI